MWTCPKCGTKVDPLFDVCWSCGTTPDGVEDPSFSPADAPSAEVSPLSVDLPPLVGTPPGLEGDLVEAYWALDLMQAAFVASKLTEEGIPAVSDTHDMHDALGSMNAGPRVWVRARTCPVPRPGSNSTTTISRRSTGHASSIELSSHGHVP